MQQTNKKLGVATLAALTLALAACGGDGGSGASVSGDPSGFGTEVANTNSTFLATNVPGSLGEAYYIRAKFQDMMNGGSRGSFAFGVSPNSQQGSQAVTYTERGIETNVSSGTDQLLFYRSPGLVESAPAKNNGDALVTTTDGATSSNQRPTSVVTSFGASRSLTVSFSDIAGGSVTFNDERGDRSNFNFVSTTLAYEATQPAGLKAAIEFNGDGKVSRVGYTAVNAARAAVNTCQFNPSTPIDLVAAGRDIGSFDITPTCVTNGSTASGPAVRVFVVRTAAGAGANRFSLYIVQKPTANSVGLGYALAIKNMRTSTMGSLFDAVFPLMDAMTVGRS